MDTTLTNQIHAIFFQHVSEGINKRLVGFKWTHENIQFKNMKYIGYIVCIVLNRWNEINKEEKKRFLI